MTETAKKIWAAFTPEVEAALEAYVQDQIKQHHILLEQYSLPEQIHRAQGMIMALKHIKNARRDAGAILEQARR